MENHSPSQDDKPEGPGLKTVMQNTLSFYDLLSQAFEPNTDGITNAFDVATVGRRKSSADFMLRTFGSGYFKTALSVCRTHRGVHRR